MAMICSQDMVAMIDERAVELRQMIQNHLPSGTEIGWETPFGADGLGMDSVAVVMLLLECEARWGVSFPAELLEQPPLTIHRMIDHLKQQGSA